MAGLDIDPSSSAILVVPPQSQRWDCNSAREGPNPPPGVCSLCGWTYTRQSRRSSYQFNGDI